MTSTRFRSSIDVAAVVADVETDRSPPGRCAVGLGQAHADVVAVATRLEFPHVQTTDRRLYDRRYCARTDSERRGLLAVRNHPHFGEAELQVLRQIDEAGTGLEFANEAIRKCVEFREFDVAANAELEIAAAAATHHRRRVKDARIHAGDIAERDARGGHQFVCTSLPDFSRLQDRHEHRVVHAARSLGTRHADAREQSLDFRLIEHPLLGHAQAFQRAIECRARWRLHHHEQAPFIGGRKELGSEPGTEPERDDDRTQRPEQNQRAPRERPIEQPLVAALEPQQRLLETVIDAAVGSRLRWRHTRGEHRRQCQRDEQ